MVSAQAGKLFLLLGTRFSEDKDHAFDIHHHHQAHHHYYLRHNLPISAAIVKFFRAKLCPYH